MHVCASNTRISLGLRREGISFQACTDQDPMAGGMPRSPHAVVIILSNDHVQRLESNAISSRADQRECDAGGTPVSSPDFTLEW
jgi:hypothetical protein